MTPRINQSQAYRNDKGQFSGFADLQGAGLRKGERVGLGMCVVNTRCLHFGCACLAVPTFELGQQGRQVRTGVGIGNGLGKIVAGYSLPVVAREIQRHAFGEARAAYQGLHHADDFGPFFVNGNRVKIVDFDVAVGPHRVCHGAGIFGELRGAQNPNVFDAFDGFGRWVST